MQISNKALVILIIVVIIMIWYIKNTKNDVSRYKNIIDTYMSENNTLKKSSIKKVRFNEPEKKTN